MDQETMDLIQGINEGFESLKNAIDTKADPEVVERIQARLDEFEIKMQAPRFGASTESKMTQEEMEHKSAFDHYVRTGNDSKMLEVKAMSSDSNPDGGYMVNPTLANRIITKLEELSPMRRFARVVRISNSNEYKVPREKGDQMGAGWVGERQARPETDTSKIEMVRIALHEMYAQPGITQTLLNDSAFDWEAYLTRKLIQRFASLENAAFYAGNGVNMPMGLLYNPAGQGIELVNGSLNFDGLIDLQTSLKEQYLMNAIYQLNRLTLREIRKLKDTTGQYLWQPSQQADKPNMILGYEYALAPDMPTQASGAYSVAFGDFMEAYTIVDGAQLYTLRDAYTSKPNILLYTTRSVGGGVENNEAVKILNQQ